MSRTSVSGLAGFVSSLGDEPVWIGVDVHKLSYHVTLIVKDGSNRTYSSPADPLGFVKQITGMGIKVSQVCYEAGPTGFTLARALESAGFPVVVAAPSRIPRPVAPGAKTDSLDSQKLAELGMRGLLKPISIPTEAEEGRRSLIRRRDQIVRDIRRVKQRIKSLLLQFGIKEPKGLSHWSHSSIRALERIDLPVGANLTLGSLLQDLSNRIEERDQVRQSLKAVLKGTDDQGKIDNMRSVPGVGSVTATTFCLELYRPERFNRSEELTSYLGLAPMDRRSGQGRSRSRLRPVGQKRLRSHLIEAAWMWKRKEPWAAAFYGRLLSRHGTPQKAIVALARKLAIILWRLCMENRSYRPGMIGN